MNSWFYKIFFQRSRNCSQSLNFASAKESFEVNKLSTVFGWNSNNAIQVFDLWLDSIKMFILNFEIKWVLLIAGNLILLLLDLFSRLSQLQAQILPCHHHQHPICRALIDAKYFWKDDEISPIIFRVNCPCCCLAVWFGCVAWTVCSVRRRRFSSLFPRTVVWWWWWCRIFKSWIHTTLENSLSSNTHTAMDGLCIYASKTHHDSATERNPSPTTTFSREVGNWAGWRVHTLC